MSINTGSGRNMYMRFISFCYVYTHTCIVVIVIVFRVVEEKYRPVMTAAVIETSEQPEPWILDRIPGCESAEANVEYDLQQLKTEA